MEYLEKFAKRCKKRNGVQNNLENEDEYKERWISIYIIYFTMFVVSLGFSVIITGVWPYLGKLDPTAGKEFMGFVIAANPLAQMIFSPLMGWWANKLGSIRLPVLLSLLIFMFSSAVYSSLEVFTEYRKYWMLASRFLVGISSSNIAACRSYLSAATRLTERTKAVSMMSLAQVLGFVIGPAVQAAVVSLGDDGVWFIPGVLKLNMYTAVGWITVILSIINFCCFLPSIFKEHNIAVREAMFKQGQESEQTEWKNKKVDYLAAWTLLMSFFGIAFNFMLLETLGTPLMMDQFAWSKAEALYYMGILLCAGAVISCVAFVLVNRLCKYFAEPNVLLWVGFLLMLLGRVLYIPWGSTTPQMYNDSIVFNNDTCDVNIHKAITVLNESISYDLNETISNNFNMNAHLITITDANNDSRVHIGCNNTTEMLGCPSSQEWCTYTPVMTIPQYILGCTLSSIGYPAGGVLAQSLYSKVLGPRPQGVWMGLMTVSGCLSRILGPVFVSYIYTKFGTIWTFSMTAVMMVLIMIWIYLCLKRLIPFEDRMELNRDINEHQELVTLNKSKNSNVNEINLQLNII